MKRIGLAIFVLCSLVLANVVLKAVLNTNQSNGVYSIDADSTGIPIMLVAGQSVLIYMVIATSFVLPKVGRIWLLINVLPALLAVSLSLKMALSWIAPHHYWIAMSFFLVALSCAWAWWQDKRKPRTVKSDK